MKNPILKTKANYNKGITLVALIITIIVLLILATVSINLVINNGILDKAKTAVDKYSEGEICEQIKLAYLECETEKLYNSNVDDVEFLTNSLKEKLSNNDLTVKVKNGKITVNMTIKGETKTYIYKSKTGQSYEYIDPFDYGEYTKENIPEGKDITLGTEKFRVFYNKNGVIKAMPYYNLVTITADGTVKQGLAIEGTSTAISSTFSKQAYWEQGNDSIDMSDSRNNIQQYIIKYEATLKDMGADVEVKVPKKSELTAEGVTSTIRNPGQSGTFWLGSGGSSRSDVVLIMSGTGDDIYGDRFNHVDGVRPIIIIEY